VGKRRSLLALDWLNFFIADVETGVGPFVALYLASSRHWNPAQIGTVVSVHSIVSVLAQAPAGWLVDAYRRKRQLIIAAISVIALGSLGIVRAISLKTQIANQVAIGLSVVFVTPTIAAISLGMVGREGFSQRAGRNAAFSHSGNMLTALVAGFVGYAIGQQWIFYVCAGFGLFSIASALGIRADDINNEAARALPPEQSAKRTPASFREMLRDSRIPLFTCSVLIFHIANAGMLPMASQELAKTTGRSSSIYMTACLVIAQLTMAPVAFFASKLTDRVGRKPIFLLGFAALVSRGILFALTRAAIPIVALEILDGVGTSIADLLAIVTISDLAAGSGRFNALQGSIQAAVGAGAFASNLSAGWLAKQFGFPTAFLALSLVALLGSGFYIVLMPETSPKKSAMGA
jgi:MFS family permease